MVDCRKAWEIVRGTTKEFKAEHNRYFESPNKSQERIKPHIHTQKDTDHAVFLSASLTWFLHRDGAVFEYNTPGWFRKTIQLSKEKGDFV